MGKDDFNHFYNEKNAMRACADMLIAAAPEHATMVIEADARHSFPGLVSHACANDEAIPPHLIDAAQVLVGAEADGAEKQFTLVFFAIVNELAH